MKTIESLMNNDIKNKSLILFFKFIVRFTFFVNTDFFFVLYLAQLGAHAYTSLMNMISWMKGSSK